MSHDNGYKHFACDEGIQTPAAASNDTEPDQIQRAIEDIQSLTLRVRQARGELRNDKSASVDSSHMRTEQSDLNLTSDLDGAAVLALRSLWSTIENVKKSGLGSEVPMVDEEALNESVRRAVNALDPARNISREEFQIAYGLKKGEDDGQYIENEARITANSHC